MLQIYTKGRPTNYKLLLILRKAAYFMLIVVHETSVTVITNEITTLYKTRIACMVMITPLSNHYLVNVFIHISLTFFFIHGKNYVKGCT